MASMQEALESLSDKSIRHIVSISGGKDSTALALYMRQSFPEIPAEYVFCDTGCELPETYEYLERSGSSPGGGGEAAQCSRRPEGREEARAQSLRPLLERALRRIFAQPAVAMVHEGAEDSAVRAVRRRQPGVQLHRHSRRRGQGGIPIEESPR